MVDDRVDVTDTCSEPALSDLATGRCPLDNDSSGTTAVEAIITVELAVGTTVDLGVLGPASVQRKLGEGGQGFVYEVSRPTGRSLALKWYRSHCASDEQYQALSYLVEQGSPNQRFLWPLALARVPGDSGFGYVMPVRDDQYIGLACLVSGTGPRGEKVEVSFTAVIMLCRQLAESFLKLHACGLCYRDISFGNVFFHPRTGDVLICDNDNVGIDNGESRVRGTPFFMAPELVRDVTWETMPSTHTDLHSLAVLLFYALCVGHPLEGAKSDAGLRHEGWLIEHFGRKPLFAFDPDNDSNRPVSKHVVSYWNAYPTFLRELFMRAFTEGLRDASVRVRETEWIKAMVRLRDTMTACTSCGQTNFWDDDQPNRPCLRCSHPLETPRMLHVGRHRIVLSSFARLWSDHIEAGGEGARLLGRVRRHPHDPDRLGFQNLSDLTWGAHLPDGRTYSLAPGKVVEALPGLQLDIGGTSVVVRTWEGERNSASRRPKRSDRAKQPDTVESTVVVSFGGNVRR